MSEELKPCPLTWAIQRLNSTPYSLTKDECVEVLRGLRDEIRALTLRPAAQAGELPGMWDQSDLVGGETDAKPGWRNLFWALARELKCLPSTDPGANQHVFRAARALASLPAQPAAQEEAVCVCPLQGCRARILPAAQATPSRDAREAEQRTRMQARLSSGKATADFDLPAPNDDIQQATPEPVGEVVASEFFAFDPEGGHAFYKTQREAIDHAKEGLKYYRDGANDHGEWDEDVEQIRWGVVMQRAKETNVSATEDGESSCDYALQDVATRPAPGVPEGFDVQAHLATGGGREYPLITVRDTSTQVGEDVFPDEHPVIYGLLSAVLAAAQAKGGQ